MKYEIKIVHSHLYKLAQMYQTNLRVFFKSKRLELGRWLSG